MMNNTTSGAFFHNLSMLLCLFIGVLLRLGWPAEMSFINDELSTWSKVNYDSVAAVIDNIKAVDSHPVGMYVFVYYWTLLFGYSEWAIKLPFFLFSFVSMYWVYSLAQRWFSKQAALIVLAYFVSLQFPIWWSGIARQYQSGLFCGLWMVHCWSKILIENDVRKRYWLGFVLAGAACMYNHYFSLIFAATVGVSGLFWVKKSYLIRYIGAGLAMLLLFAPHWPITIYQLTNADGHLWYAVPDASFFGEYIRYLFHFSNLSLILLASIVLLGVRFHKISKQQKSLILLSLCWFLFPLLFGYWYSVTYSPILRTSHLLFSFPFLLFFLFGAFNNHFSKAHTAGLLLLILSSNIYTLVVDRQHFRTMNSHPYEHFVAHTKDFLETHPNAKLSVVLGENPEYIQYYKSAYDSDFKHYSSFKPPIYFQQFNNIIAADSLDYLIVGNLPEAHYSLAFDLFPHVYKQSYGINYEYYILSKKPVEAPVEMDMHDEIMTFDAPIDTTKWAFDSTNIRYDSLNTNSVFSFNEEWGPTYSRSLDFLPHANYIIDISIDVKAVDSLLLLPRGVLVLEMTNGKENFWEGVEIHQQTDASSDWQTLYLSLRFAHEKFYKNVRDYKIKTYFWNREKQAIQLDNFKLCFRKGNPILYGDTNEFIP